MLRMLLVIAMAIAAQGVAAQSSVKWTPLNASSRQQSEQRAPGPAPVTPTVTTKAVPSTEDSAAAAIPENLALLRGKKVMVGRIALCVPNTFQPNLAYAGQIATVVGFKANQTLNSVNLAMLPPGTRAMMQNIKMGGVLLLQFEDGTKLDTCAPQGSNQLSPNLELAPGETIPAGSVASNSMPPTMTGDAPASAPATITASAPQSCPLALVKVSAGDSFGHMLVDTLTTSELQRQIDEVNHGGVGKHYLDVQVRNDSGKPVRAFEFSAVYANSMGDEGASATFDSQNDKSIKAGSVYKISAMDRDLLIQNGRGEVMVYVSRVRFDDDSLWLDNGSRSCRLKASFR